MSILKMGWGTRIALLYFGFVALIITLVTKSMHQDFDLVTKDYYNEELKYQDVINASQNQAGLSAAISLQQAGDQLQILFPKEFQEGTYHGTAHFYSQANAAWDRTYELDIAHGQCHLATAELQATNYLVKLQWQSGDKKYYQETPITIH